MQSAVTPLPIVDADDSAGEFLDSEHRLMRVLLEQIANLPADQRVDIATAFYAQLGAEGEDNAPWRNRYRKELARSASDEIDATRVEATLRAKRAARS